MKKPEQVKVKTPRKETIKIDRSRSHRKIEKQFLADESSEEEFHCSNFQLVEEKTKIAARVSTRIQALRPRINIGKGSKISTKLEDPNILPSDFKNKNEDKECMAKQKNLYPETIMPGVPDIRKNHLTQTII